MSLDLLAPVLGGVQQLLARLTAERAAKMDDILVDTAALDARLTATRASYIDAIKSSTDSHTTSLATVLARLTDARAAKLDKIFGLNSIQRGTITIADSALTNTATITAVDPAKALLLYGGVEGDRADQVASDLAVRLVLTNATTVTAVRGTSGDPVVVSWQVIEFE